MMENTKADAMLALAYAIQPGAQTVVALREALEWLEGAIELEEATKAETP
jgi:P2-related tail formation protein